MKKANLIVLLITFFVLLGCESDGEEINLPTPLQDIESEVMSEILWKKKILKNSIFGRFDIHFDDRLGKLKITEEGINMRDKIVIENFFLKKIPICGVLGGGYNKDFNKLIELHSSLHKTCAKYI